MSTVRRSFAIALLVAAPFATVAADDSGPSWTGQVTPYIWAAGAGGTLRPIAGGPSIEIDRSFSEIVDDLDSALFLSAFARRDRIVLLGDLSHTSTSRSGVASVPGAGSLAAQGSLRQTSLTLAAGYRADTTQFGTFDLLAGLRTWDMRGTVTVPATGLSASREIRFTDPIVAARMNLRLADRASLLLYGDIGGFGAGSEQTTQFVATLNFALSPQVHFSIGYRQLDVDYRDEGRRVDMRLAGPIAGLTLRF
jgi:hypothetical protein